MVRMRTVRQQMQYEYTCNATVSSYIVRILATTIEDPAAGKVMSSAAASDRLNLIAAALKTDSNPAVMPVEDSLQLEDRYPVPEIQSDWLDKLIFLGTGTSGQVPAIHCIAPDPSQEHEAIDKPFDINEISCPACADAVRYGDKSPNRRLCTGAIITGSSKKKGKAPVTGADQLTIMIDCGPTFYSSAVDVFPKHSLRRIDACLLTHAHADAIFGLDHLRAWTLGQVMQAYVDIYLTQETMDTVASTYPYLVDTKKATGGGGVGALRWHIIDSSKPFVVEQNPAGGSGRERQRVTVTPLSVQHGFRDARTGKDPFEFVGFRIGELSYISDCSYIPPEASKLIEGSKALVIDALKWERHTSHYSIAQALRFSLSISSLELVLMTDLTHMLEHHDLSEQVARWEAGMRAVARSLPPVPQRTQSRWWKGYWDEHESESTRNLRMLSVPKASGSSAAAAAAAADAPNVPVFRVAYDRQAIRFR